MTDLQRGKMIVIEGTDGSGKGTQAGLLTEYLTEKHIPYLYVDFPDYTSFYGQMVAQFLRGEYGSIESTSPYLVSLLYALDRKHMRNTILQALENGKIVVANRYTTSNQAHQGSKFNKINERDTYIKWVAHLEYDICKLPKEDIVIYLRVPAKLSTELTRKKSQRTYLKGRTVDIHEENEKHITSTSTVYDELSTMYPHWVTIDCAPHGTIMSKEEIHTQILKELHTHEII